MLVSLVEADPTDPTRGCLVVNASAHGGALPTPADRVTAALRQVESAVAGALEQARARGAISADKDPREPARFLTTFTQGLRVVGRGRTGREFAADALSTAMRALD
ncbi:TetR family transcriptional regulator C-terminal domain-containing protein [Streptomyces sp. NPDC101237]|uniref:TetR family transcriptional regulator C-terminal domain-containing protein n=1 Tax=Streptomyces sp. NPDC101237 TaxID=3366139 RepID=UPI003804596C